MGIQTVWRDHPRPLTADAALGATAAQATVAARAEHTGDDAQVNALAV
jgi:hypothetical protein